MVCEKCGYLDEKETKLFGHSFCRVCSIFAPREKEKILDYIDEKIDWKQIDSFRKYFSPETNKKKSMEEKAKNGRIMARPPMGYGVVEGELVLNKDASKVHSLFRTFLNRKYSLNSLAKNFGLSVNGIKKILTNRVYLGEIKFNNQIYKGNHKPLISPEIFYAVQRKLKTYLKPKRKNIAYN